MFRPLWPVVLQQAADAVVALGCSGWCSSAVCNTCDTVDIRSVGWCRRTTSVGLWQSWQQLSCVDCVTSHQWAVCRRVVSCCWLCRHRCWDCTRLPHDQRWQVCIHWWHSLDGNWRWKVITTNIFIMQCYASMVSVFVICLSVCLYVCYMLVLYHNG